MQNISQKIRDLRHRDPEVASLVHDRIQDMLNEGIANKTYIARKIASEFPSAFMSIESARSHVRKKIESKGYVHARTEMGADSRENSSDFLLAKSRKAERSRYYIVTWAQNNTPVFMPFWENILLYASAIGASIHVIAGRYKNPTSIFSDKNEEKWADVLLPYLDASVHDIHERVKIVSNIKIQPTSSSPLNGMESVAQGKTCVFGHPRVHMKTLPTIYDNGVVEQDVYSLVPQFLFTTGAVTVADYTDSNAGAKGDHHHTYGFVIIELLGDGSYRIRQVKARKDDGSFTDLYWNVSDKGIQKVDGVKAIVFGDLHVAKMSSLSIERVLSMINEFSPQYAVVHDVFDGESINPHEKDNPIRQYLSKRSMRHSLSHEIDATVTLVNVLSEITNVVVVNSNHDYFLEKYIISSDWKKDIDNAPQYMEYALAMLNKKTPNGLLSHIIDSRSINPEKVTCLGVDQSFVIGNRECGQHGHLGTSGSKGSPHQFKRLSKKNITGHTHSPLRIDGLTVVGCQDIFHGYNKGLSNWWLCDVLIHNDNKDQQILHLGKKVTSIEL